MPFTYTYARPALTVDCAVFGFDDARLKVLLIRRGLEPFKNSWALPGGFVAVAETIEEAARRELLEETGLADVYLEQLHTFGALGRDPRERVVSVAHVALVRRAVHIPLGGTDAAEAGWFPADTLPALAFDHGEILSLARRRLRDKIRQQPVGFELLPPKFTLTQLQSLYEAVLGRALDKRNFRKKLAALDLLSPLDETTSAGSKRPAQLFRFDRKKYEKLTRQGIAFDL